MTVNPPFHGRQGASEQIVSSIFTPYNKVQSHPVRILVVCQACLGLSETYVREIYKTPEMNLAKYEFVYNIDSRSNSPRHQIN